MHLSSLLRHTILILGCGVEGISTYRYLRKQHPTKALGIADKRDMASLSNEVQEELSRDPYLELHFGQQYLLSLPNYNLIIKSPGINRRIPEIQKFLHKGKLTTSVNIFIANATGTIIGITGSKGKSTSSSCLHHILKKAYKTSYLCGNIGTPVLDVIQESSRETYFVLELSSQQIEDMRYQVHVGMFTSFFPDHMDYHGDVNAYFAAKTKIFDPKTVVFYNEKFDKIRNFFQNNNFPRKIGYMNQINSIYDNHFMLSCKPFFPTNGLQIVGEHNQENMLGCILLAQHLRIDDTIIQTALQSFTPLEHRLEYIGKYQEIDIYNDSASVTPESTIEAIKALESNNIGCLILGGMDRGYNFYDLGKAIIKYNVATLILLPDTHKKYQETLQKLGFTGQIFEVDSMEEAVKSMWKQTAKDTVCLFSPGCPSYNEYASFVERGKSFCFFVKKYI